MPVFFAIKFVTYRSVVTIKAFAPPLPECHRENLGALGIPANLSPEPQFERLSSGSETLEFFASSEKFSSGLREFGL